METIKLVLLAMLIGGGLWHLYDDSRELVQRVANHFLVGDPRNSDEKRN
jgi:hypothetical protein